MPLNTHAHASSHPPLHIPKQVILSCGAIASPQLLQLSGIGPPKLLDKLGLPVIAPLIGVGGNLTDHLEVYHQYEV